eukprot:gnl/MRDRNA2_/MRDRNA2_143677_c0_seq1.p1 gnl/MRDRNA2_/MRDRNA2_143677_c0~~gnl/MRDRNA2_/MRDRNA2_143677_c0_seq1.p1  ORF type:complete len:422 (+),score=34.46 gnl/MRDRNA2_/MRDRNA2_143677_c0_seq1:65-1330(+)
MFRSQNHEFGQQGQRQSQDCAFHVCTICNAPVRMSYWVPLFFGYNLYTVLRQGQQGAGTDWLFWSLLYTAGNQMLLLMTVLCHEFGHGTMARRIGGQIDHVLLWIFGGICFSTRPRDHDRERLLKNDFAVVCAGPATHFPQAAVWAALLCLLYLAIGFDEVSGYSATGYETVWDSIVACLQPLGPGLEYTYLFFTKGKWVALPWALVGSAIRLNVWLFLFNVLFPMYPADGSKLLVTTLMWSCGVPARIAALVLLCVSVPCGLAFIGYSLYSFGLSLTNHSGGPDLLTGVLGYMGVMSLMEARRIRDLRRQGQLHQHPLFATARSWRRTRRDHMGLMQTINTAEEDDAQDENWGKCCPCFPRFAVGNRWASTQEPQRSQTVTTAAQPAPATAEQRQQRGDFLNRLEQRQAQDQRTVRDLTR